MKKGYSVALAMVMAGVMATAAGFVSAGAFQTSTEWRHGEVYAADQTKDQTKDQVRDCDDQVGDQDPDRDRDGAHWDAAAASAWKNLAAVRASNGKGAGDQARDEKKSMDRSC